MYGAYCLASDAYPVLPFITSQYNLAGQKVVFITTASETVPFKDRKACFENEVKLGKKLGLKLDITTLSNQDPPSLLSRIENAAAFYVCGGDVCHLGLQMRQLGFKKIIKKFVDKGGIYIGDSAGSVIMGNRLDIGYPPNYFKNIPPKHLTGFRFTTLSLLVHWGTPYYQKQYDQYPKGTNGSGILKLSDGQYLLIDKTGENVVSPS